MRREQSELAAAAAARRAMYSGPAAAHGPTLYTNYNNPAGSGNGAPPPPPRPMPMVPRGDGQHAMAASVAAHVHSTAMAEHAARSAAGGAAGASDGGAHANGVALERAVCAVLLGDYTAAVERLGLDTNAAVEQEQLREFVLVRRGGPTAKRVAQGLEIPNTMFSYTSPVERAMPPPSARLHCTRCGCRPTRPTAAATCARA